jgi:hypothetical protein
LSRTNEMKLHRQANMKWGLLLTFFVDHVSGVLANIMTESSWKFRIPLFVWADFYAYLHPLLAADEFNGDGR